jgi:hypothetical protein
VNSFSVLPNTTAQETYLQPIKMKLKGKEYIIKRTIKELHLYMKAQGLPFCRYSFSYR